jgi:hypothetical protein
MPFGTEAETIVGGDTGWDDANVDHSNCRVCALNLFLPDGEKMKR